MINLILNINLRQIICLFLPFYLVFSINTEVFGYNSREIILESNNHPPMLQDGVLRATISRSADLPEDFYGTWTVLSTLIETNNPGLFRLRSSDIWTFSRAGDVITLSNPTTGASASITVNEVHGNTAIFTRIKEEKDYTQIETPEITVEGDNFFGTDLIVIEHYRRGRKVSTDRVKYELRGYKISGPALKDLFAK